MKDSVSGFTYKKFVFSSLLFISVLIFSTLVNFLILRSFTVNTYLWALLIMIWLPVSYLLKVECLYSYLIGLLFLSCAAAFVALGYDVWADWAASVAFLLLVTAVLQRLKEKTSNG